MSKQEITTGLIHAIRGQVTLYNFAETESDKKEALNQVTRIVERTELLTGERLASSNSTCSLNEAIMLTVGKLDHERVFVDMNHECTVEGSLFSVRLVVEELLENALRYSKGQVYVSTHLLKRSVVLRIEDSGRGLSGHVINNISEPFVASAHKNAGAGLGLALAWAAVRGFDGSLTFQNDTNSGLTVIVGLNLV